MRYARLLALAASLAVATPALPVLAQNAPTKAQQQEAASRFKKGIDLFKDGDFKAALIEFRRANELAPNFNVLYNIGQVYFQLQDYPNALGTLQRYLSEGGSKIPASRRAEVERDIEKLRSRVANLEILTAVPDSEIAIDDEPIGKSPLNRTIMVSAGKHKITVSKTGFAPASKTIEIASQDSVKVTLDPTEAPKAPPPPPNEQPKEVVLPPVDSSQPPATPPPVAPKATVVPWAGIIITSGLVVGAVTTGILALGASSDLKALRASPDATRDSLTKARDKTTAFALITDILAGGSLVSLGVTIYVGVSSNSDKPAKKPDNKPAAPAQPASRPMIKVGVGPGSVLVGGLF